MFLTKARPLALYMYLNLMAPSYTDTHTPYIGRVAWGGRQYFSNISWEENEMVLYIR